MAAEVHRYKVGDIEVTVLSDGFRMVPVNGNYLSNASADDLAKALAAAGQPTDKMKNTGRSLHRICRAFCDGRHTSASNVTAGDLAEGCWHPKIARTIFPACFTTRDC